MYPFLTHRQLKASLTCIIYKSRQTAEQCSLAPAHHLSPKRPQSYASAICLRARVRAASCVARRRLRLPCHADQSGRGVHPTRRTNYIPTILHHIVEY